MGVSNEFLILYDALSVIIQIVSVLLNTAILFTISKRSLLKYPSNRFVFSLCSSHLIASLYGISISVLSPLWPAPENNEALESSEQALPGASLETLPDESVSLQPEGCQSNYQPRQVLSHLMLYMTFIVAINSSLTVALISVERYVTIARPMKYKSIITPRRSLAIIGICWMTSTLLTTFPLMTFDETRTILCGSFAIPVESLGQYFAIVFITVTFIGLIVMIVCYTHIFRIARKKCQKVQIGQFTSPVSSISSDWPSSAYSSMEGHKWYPTGSRVTSSNNLLHWVLMANLGRHTPLRLPPGPNYESSREARSTAAGPVESTTNSSSSQPTEQVAAAAPRHPPLRATYSHSPTESEGSGSPPQSRKRSWRSLFFLKQSNYNSPRKTILTIMVLVGSVLVTQLPMASVLFIEREANMSLFYFCYTVLFSCSSLSNPILYGFLNRSIRVQLWKLFRVAGRRSSNQKLQMKIPCEFNSMKLTSLSGSTRSNCTAVARTSPPNMTLPHGIPVGHAAGGSVRREKQLVWKENHNPTVKVSVNSGRNVHEGNRYEKICHKNFILYDNHHPAPGHRFSAPVEVTPYCHKPGGFATRRSIPGGISSPLYETTSLTTTQVLVEKNSSSSPSETEGKDQDGDKSVAVEPQDSISASGENLGLLSEKSHQSSNEKLTQQSKQNSQEPPNVSNGRPQAHGTPYSSFPRKTSQDSGADVTFSEDEEESDELPVIKIIPCTPCTPQASGSLLEEETLNSFYRECAPEESSMIGSSTINIEIPLSCKGSPTSSLVTQGSVEGSFTLLTSHHHGLMLLPSSPSSTSTGSDLSLPELHTVTEDTEFLCQSSRTSSFSKYFHGHSSSSDDDDHFTACMVTFARKESIDEAIVV